MANKKASRADLEKARRIHRKRPLKAQQVDESLTARVTEYFQVWKTDPSRWDLMGVDTKKQGKKNRDLLGF